MQTRLLSIWTHAASLGEFSAMFSTERPKTVFTLFALFWVSRSTASTLDALSLYQTGVQRQQFAGIPARKLLQDSAVCGFNEYFCGEKAFISDTAYSAVSAGNCFNDTGTYLPSRRYVDQKDRLSTENLLQMCSTAGMTTSQSC